MTLLELDSLYSTLTPTGGTEFIRAIRAADRDPQISALLLLGKLERFIAEFRPEGKRIRAVRSEFIPINVDGDPGGLST